MGNFIPAGTPAEGRVEKQDQYNELQGNCRPDLIVTYSCNYFQCHLWLHCHFLKVIMNEEQEGGTWLFLNFVVLVFLIQFLVSYWPFHYNILWILFLLIVQNTEKLARNLAKCFYMACFLILLLYYFLHLKVNHWNGIARDTKSW